MSKKEIKDSIKLKDKLRLLVDEHNQNIQKDVDSCISAIKGIMKNIASEGDHALYVRFDISKKLIVSKVIEYFRLEDISYYFVKPEFDNELKVLLSWFDESKNKYMSEEKIRCLLIKNKDK